jgi:hypothetical protein
MNSFTLSIDTANRNPTASIGYVSDKSNSFTIESISLTGNELALTTDSALPLTKRDLDKPNQTKNKRSDSVFFVNKIAELCEKVNCKPSDIKQIAICSGPGGFSSLRVGIVIARLICLSSVFQANKKVPTNLNPDLQNFFSNDNSDSGVLNGEIHLSDFGLKIYKFNLLYLFYRKLKSSGLFFQSAEDDETSRTIYLKGGLSYFKESYDSKTNKIIEPAHLVKESEAIQNQPAINSLAPPYKGVGGYNSIVIDEAFQLLSSPLEEGWRVNNFSEFMIKLLDSEDSDLASFSVNFLSELQPDYLREASVTMKKKSE